MAATSLAAQRRLRASRSAQAAPAAPAKDRLRRWQLRGKHLSIPVSRSTGFPRLPPALPQLPPLALRPRACLHRSLGARPRCALPTAHPRSFACAARCSRSWRSSQPTPNFAPSPLPPPRSPPPPRPRPWPARVVASGGHEVRAQPAALPGRPPPAEPTAMAARRRRPSAGARARATSPASHTPPLPCTGISAQGPAGAAMQEGPCSLAGAELCAALARGEVMRARQAGRPLSSAAAIQSRR